MPDPQGRVQRWDFTGDAPQLWYRQRHTALFAEEEWGWTLDRALAWVFPKFAAKIGDETDDADKHAAALRAANVPNVSAVVVALEEQLLDERAKRRQAAVDTAEASLPRPSSITPEQAYAETARRLGEHDDAYLEP